MPKEYKKVLESLTSLATGASIQNKLNKIYISTEDKQLQQLLAPAIDDLVKFQRAAVSPKVTNQKIQCDLSISPFNKLSEYCVTAIKTEKPQWQIIAEKNGWSKK